jgi:hypothetical protein
LHRRNFVTSILAGSASVASLEGALQSDAREAVEYYELRRYQLQSGPQVGLMNHYLSQALIPALNRHGIRPVGVFNLEIGVETPAIYVLIPATSLEKLASIRRDLRQDRDYLDAAKAYLTATSQQPAYVRLESSLMVAFEGTKLTVPPPAANNGKRIFQMRTYESPSQQAHARKIEMFESGEFEIFKRAGFWQVFYGDTLIGSRLPNLTYMLSFPDISDMNAFWEAFRNDPQWRRLTSDPRFTYDEIVTNVTNIILNPAKYSQI